jgi:hypothetical protein
MKRKREFKNEEDLPYWKKRKKEKPRCLEVYHKAVKQVIFYGVGCSSEEIKSQIIDLFGLEGKKIVYLNGDGFPVVGLAHLPSKFKLFVQVKQEYNEENDKSLKWDPTTLKGANFRISDDDRSIKQIRNTSMGGAFLNRKFVEGDKYFWLMEHAPLWCCVTMRFHYGTGKEEYKSINIHRQFSLNYSTLSETPVKNKGIRLVGFYLDLNTYKVRVSEHIHKKVVAELDLSEHKGSKIAVSIDFKHDPKITIRKSTKIIPAYFNDEILTNEDCSICLDKMNISYKVYATRCGHYFHKSCIVDKVEKCPLCRRELLTSHDSQQQPQPQQQQEEGTFEDLNDFMIALFSQLPQPEDDNMEIVINNSDSDLDSDSDDEFSDSDDDDEYDIDLDENGNLSGFIDDTQI